MTPARSEARERLLEAVVEQVDARGVGDLTLRGLARAVGTSHRMLIYHFGSREGLLAEIVRAIEARQRDALAEMRDAEPSLAPDEIARRMWSRLADPSLWPQERLFFEVYARALQGDPGARPLLDDVVDSWVRSGMQDGAALGLDPGQAADHARLSLAVVRGLLLDLLATGDRAAVDRAMERFLALAAAAAPAVASNDTDDA